jgi:hypothetical protein
MLDAPDAFDTVGSDPHRSPGGRLERLVEFSRLVTPQGALA